MACNYETDRYVGDTSTFVATANKEPRYTVRVGNSVRDATRSFH